MFEKTQEFGILIESDDFLQNILSTNSQKSGLLHDIPSEVLKRYPDLPELIKKCATQEDIHNTQKQSIGEILWKLIEEIVPAEEQLQLK